VRSSHTITLFSERPVLVQRPSSFLISILVHGGLACLIAFGVISPPRVNQLPKERFAVRHLDLIAPEPEQRRAEEKGISYPGPKSDTHAPLPDESASARLMTLDAPRLQTLVQPDVPAPITLPDELKVPSLLIWKSQKMVVKTIVPPPLQKPASAEVLPSFNKPNQEAHLADIRMSSTDFSTQKLPMFPSNTSPVVVHGPDSEQNITASTAAGSGEPTSAAVLSLSDQRMNGGTVFLPPGNESASSSSPGGLTAGKDSGQPGDGSSAGKAGGTGADHAGGEKTGSSPGSDNGSGSGYQFTTTRIAMAKDGQFGAVVVGSSLEDKYPDVPALWGGRLVYTVYLHVGLAKSWIFQYSLPSAEDATKAGEVTRIEAPWPYNIVRPDIPSGAIDADVLMIHGFVNKDGRFESLTVVFPPQFAQAKFVLDALKQWEFRPATQDGQAAKVEVALIVPEETE